MKAFYTLRNANGSKVAFGYMTADEAQASNARLHSVGWEMTWEEGI